ncbi:MAG: hypothetical protein JNG86_22420 [Verrucomicrobiaceae bacterium]|nr:hypothetical protein [Verrucomicrobiaceae bacterium]
MLREYYYPRRVAEQPAWHFNYADQLEERGVGIGLQAAAVAASVNDSRQVGHIIGAWLHSVREFSLACTAQAEFLKHGSGSMPFLLPTFMPPEPPEGLTVVLPGALDRIFRFVGTIKGAPGYTEGIGLLMGIVGREVTRSADGAGPSLRLALNQVPEMQEVLLKFIKDGHQGVWIEGRRAGGGWEFLTISTRGPYIDTRPLLVPGQAETREYRAMFWDQGNAHGDWGDVARITVAL